MLWFLCQQPGYTNTCYRVAALLVANNSGWAHQYLSGTGSIIEAANSSRLGASILATGWQHYWYPIIVDGHTSTCQELAALLRQQIAAGWVHQYLPGAGRIITTQSNEGSYTYVVTLSLHIATVTFTQQ